MTTRIVIPARLQSSRLAEKVLLPIHGRSMLEWVWRRAVASDVGEVVVATDHPRIVDVVEGFGGTVMLTSAEHVSGGDRVAEVARRAGWDTADRVINLQADEPQMPAACLRQLARLSDEHDDAVASLYQPLDNITQLNDSSVVKVVCDVHGRALYFSRAAIPWRRDSTAQSDSNLAAYRRHLGLYAYPVELLLRWSQLPPSPCEQVEKLEQLRMLEHGIPIVLAAAAEAVPAGIDTAEDWQRVVADWDAYYS
ncbi:MAG: 3-deoxy-manno-octulosonate cytidylyltransferase [Wenzhouxiangellaceae bacterium]